MSNCILFDLLRQMVVQPIQMFSIRDMVVLAPLDLDRYRTSLQEVAESPQVWR